MFNIFSNDPTKKMTQKEIDLETSRLKYITAAGGLIIMCATFATAAIKLSNELKK